MSDTNVIKLAQPGVFIDSLTEVLRNGAHALLTQAVEAEVAEFLAKHADLKTETGQRRVVRHGHLPEREIMTGIGPVAIAGPTASIWRPGSRSRRSASWSSSARRLKVGRSLSASPMAFARAHNHGVICCSI